MESTCLQIVVTYRKIPYGAVFLNNWVCGLGSQLIFMSGNLRKTFLLRASLVPVMNA